MYSILRIFFVHGMKLHVHVLMIYVSWACHTEIARCLFAVSTVILSVVSYEWLPNFWI